jgi:flavin reductase (DIM6/NTAB) family NADH-FMN oxidoreductase RutF
MENFAAEKEPTEALRATFRLHASGVSVITLLDAEGKPAGFTATSMTSLGANPPLASFNVARGSSTWPSLQVEKYVAIHTLGERNLELAQRMAADHTLRFAKDDWKIGSFGLPVFTDATSVLIGKIRDIHAIENNAVVIVDVLEGLLGQEAPALLYYQRHYMTPGKSLN